MLRERVQAGLSMPAFLELPHENRELWHAVHDHARVSEAQVARALALGGPWHLLVLNEPWCGDAVNTLPVLARLVEHLPGCDRSRSLGDGGIAGVNAVFGRR